MSFSSNYEQEVKTLFDHSQNAAAIIRSPCPHSQEKLQKVKIKLPLMPRVSINYNKISYIIQGYYKRNRHFQRYVV